MALPITYRYEVYRNNTYLGLLPKVSSEFSYAQDINTPGTQLIITTAQDIDTQYLAVNSLIDESGNQLTDESGNTLTTSRASDIYGNNIFNSMIQSGNEIKVWEFTQWQPNGVLVFDGIIKRWNPHIGLSDTIDITVLSYGIELDNDILYGGQTVDQSNIGFDWLNAHYYIYGSTGKSFAQIIVSGNAIKNIGGVSFYGISFNAAATVNVSIYVYTSGAPDSGTLLGTTANITVPSYPFFNVNVAPPIQSAAFSSPITISANTSYALVWNVVTLNGGVDFSLASSTTAYTGGASQFWNGSTWGNITGSTNSFAFETYTINSYGLFTNSAFYNTDPASILTTIISNYNTGGGHVTVGNITSSSVVASYKFVLNTVLEGITSCLSLAPSGYYWYVDPGSSKIYFQPRSVTPDHYFTFKVHINSFELLATSETTVNAAYLTAGNDSSGNLILTYAQNTTSIANFGRILKRITDTRIIDTTTAKTVIDNYVQTNSAENYQSTLTIHANNYDLTTLAWGQVIGFNGSNTYIDTLTMTIVNIARYEDYAVLTLGTVPIRSSTAADAINRSLTSSQTVNNPLTPS